MRRMFGSLIVTASLLSSSAFAAPIRVTIKALDSRGSSTFDWLNGWGAIALSATGPDGQVYQPERDEASLVLPAPGLYRFSGSSLGVCGIDDQEQLISEASQELILTGWCE